MNNATKKARLDKNGTAKPLTRLVGQVPRDGVVLPGGRNATNVRLVKA